MTPPTRSQTTNTARVSLGAIAESSGSRIVLYGTGGIGKTTLACMMPGPVAFVDADESLPDLKQKLKKGKMPAPVIVPASNWSTLKSSLQSGGWEKIKTIVIDSATKTEEWCIAHVLRTVRSDSDATVTSVEGYGYGKGYKYVYEEYLKLLSWLDAHVREGRNIVLIAHECTANYPNPRGPDYPRYEPRLMDKPNNSIRHKVKEWSSSTLFMSYDLDVVKEGKKDKKGKAVMGGSRMIYTAEQAFCMAKSRTADEEQIAVEEGENPWPIILG